MTTDQPDTRPELLIIAPMMPFVMEALERDYRTHRLWEQPDASAYLVAHGAGIQGVATNGGVGLKAEVMAALPALEMVAIYGVGLDAIDLRESARRGIRVSSTPDVLTNDVADQGLALLLAVARQVVYGDGYVRSGQWAGSGEMALTTRLGGKRAGIVGLGRVGQALARRLSALEMDVAYTDRAELAGQPYAFSPDVLSLAREVDVLIVAAAGGDSTRKMINSDVLAALGKGGILINISRGSIVDEDALVSALQSGQLGGAGLDVFAHEPKVPPALLELDNVVLAPHAASGTRESRREMGELVLDNLEAFFAGEPLPTPVKLPEAK
ncbi:2-hydroxyacid dehydrogenase [Deinococcus marmoris]|uniref:D-3-phosphoglycerate dehydrogenase n=1 Tax=Deinococcus marmoris TaxID=249408 RepID=A0A1U7NSV7_9DEIO|nr:2-hydroxyacid dehydrogenase [Deinococcus marmoris]OLV16008.1 D-3-phosphoglycerate dehydrogenase [Deinococcus marmoris]